MILGSRKGAVSYVDTATRADWARLRRRVLLAVSLAVTVPFCPCSSRMGAGAGPRECAQSGSVRGRPKMRSALVPGKAVMALIWLPERVSTRIPLAWAIGACGSRM